MEEILDNPLGLPTEGHSSYNTGEYVWDDTVYLCAICKEYNVVQCRTDTCAKAYAYLCLKGCRKPHTREGCRFEWSHCWGTSEIVIWDDKIDNYRSHVLKEFGYDDGFDNLRPRVVESLVWDEEESGWVKEEAVDD